MKKKLFSKELIPNKILAGLFIGIAVVSVLYAKSAAAATVFFAAIMSPILFFVRENYVSMGVDNDDHED